MSGRMAASIRSRSSRKPPSSEGQRDLDRLGPGDAGSAAATLGQSGVRTTAESPGPTVAWQARSSATIPLAVTTTSAIGSSSTPWSLRDLVGDGPRSAG